MVIFLQAFGVPGSWTTSVAEVRNIQTFQFSFRIICWSNTIPLSQLCSELLTIPFVYVVHVIWCALLVLLGGIVNLCKFQLKNSS